MADFSHTMPDPVAGEAVTKDDIDVEGKNESFTSLEKNQADDGVDVFELDGGEGGEQLRRTEALEARLDNDEASDAEYKIETAHDIATKVLSTRDDPETPCLTFRMLFIGIGFSAFGSVLAQLYYFKPQTLLVSQSFLVIVTYFLGKAWEVLIPSRGILRYVNPGPFNIKEHAAAIIMCSTAAGSATAIQVISVQDLFYNNELNGGIAVFTLLASQLIGYGFAGLLIETVVHPSITYWPASVVTASIFQAFHFNGGLSRKRTKVFWLVFAGIFCWEIFPQWIFPLLTGVSIVCLVNHTNPVLRNVFGGASNNEGMGLLSWCFDWNLIGSACLYTPLWTQVNMDIGILFTYILMSALYYGNAWNGQTFPFMSQAIFTSNGSEYNQTLILTNNRFDPAKYAEVGPAFYSASNALSLLTGNLAVGATTVHVFLFYHEELQPFYRALNPWNKDKSVVHDEHYEKMKAYKSIPRWWFVVMLVIAFAMAQATNYTGKSDFTWWMLIVVLIISLFFTTVYAVTSAILGFGSFNGGLDGLFQILGSYMAPGDPIANMYAALYGSQPTIQGINLLNDLKLGQYTKIPPRVNFLVQVIGCVVGAILNYIIMLSVISEQRAALLSISGTRLWSGQNAQSFNSNAIAWGALGPELFSAGKTYFLIPLGLAIGCFLPIPGYLLHRRFPKNTFWRNLNTGVVSQYSCYLSVGVNSSIFPAIVLGVFSQWFMRSRYPKWFAKYNFVVAGALDGGTQVISFILNLAVFGAVGQPHDFPQWWGNDLNYSADRCLLPSD